jgi:serine protease AprX
MSFSYRKTQMLGACGGLGLLGAAVLLGPTLGQPETQSVIVQGTNLTAVAAAVRTAGGEITHELGLIGAVAAKLTEAQRQALRSSPGIGRIYENGTVTSAAKPAKPVVDSTTLVGTDPSTLGSTMPDETGHSTLVGADRLHAAGITGAGVTLAVLDSGLFSQKNLTRNVSGQTRVLAQYDAIAGKQLSVWDETDGSGHGTHVAAIGLNSATASGKYLGIAPNAGFVSVKAFDAAGKGSYADVIRGLDWLVANKNAYQVRVLNLSFSAPPQSFYWDDPLNQAVMKAWQAGIVVVASAGNTGPKPMTIGVPGNVPYVITVGAMTDNHTPADPSDDRLTTFSAAGPTAEGRRPSTHCRTKTGSPRVVPVAVAVA